MLSHYVQASGDHDILTRALPLAEVRNHTLLTDYISKRVIFLERVPILEHSAVCPSKESFLGHNLHDVSL